LSVTAVLRRQGERTQDAARDLLEAQAPGVHVLEVSPLEAAVMAGFEIALESGAEWLLTCDADLLIRPGAVTTLLAAAGRLPPDTFHIMGWIEDKLYPQRREGGIRLWRTSHIPKMKKIGTGGKRPESFIVHGMVAKGYRHIKLPDVLSEHDYHQWYRDLHRKGAQHRWKHSTWKTDALPMWRRSKDPDHKACLAGWERRPLEMAEKPPLEYRIEGGTMIPLENPLAT
jgi:hypothetical protein